MLFNEAVSWSRQNTGSFPAMLILSSRHSLRARVLILDVQMLCETKTVTEVLSAEPRQHVLTQVFRSWHTLAFRLPTWFCFADSLQRLLGHSCTELRWRFRLPGWFIITRIRNSANTGDRVRGHTMLCCLFLSRVLVLF